MSTEPWLPFIFRYLRHNRGWSTVSSLACCVCQHWWTNMITWFSGPARTYMGPYMWPSHQDHTCGLDHAVGPNSWTKQLDQTVGPHSWTIHVAQPSGPYMNVAQPSGPYMWPSHQDHTCGLPIRTIHVAQPPGPYMWPGHQDHTCGPPIRTIHVARPSGPYMWPTHQDHTCGPPIMTIHVARPSGPYVAHPSGPHMWAVSSTLYKLCVILSKLAFSVQFPKH